MNSFLSTMKRNEGMRGRRRGARLSFLGTGDRMCGNGTKFHQGRFRLGIRKNLHRLPRLVDAHASQCSIGIWIMPSLMFFNF